MDNKDLIRRWLRFAEGGFDGSFDTYVATSYVGHQLGGADIDRTELERLERAFARAFPDATYAVEDLIAEADKVVLRVVTRGTHRASFEGIAATGRAVDFAGLVIYRISDQRIAESWAAMDFYRFMHQLRGQDARTADGGR